MIRALRPPAASEPAWQRMVRREARVLAPLADIDLYEGPGGPVLRLPLTGRPLGTPPLTGELARPLLTGLAALRRWERAGLGLLAPARDELRVDDRGVVKVACLWPVQGTVQPALTALASRLLGAVGDRGDDALGAGAADGIAWEALLARVRALAEHDSTAADAGRLARSALAEGLAARRHALVAAWRGASHRRRSARLVDLVQRLQSAVPAPTGRGAIGVDLDGAVTAVTSDGLTVRWATPDRLEDDADDDADDDVVYEPSQGVRPATARRLLRSRALCPSNPVLDAEVGGRPAQTEAICRWVAAALQLRTIRLLLQRASA
jgi:hypothetical protein